MRLVMGSLGMMLAVWWRAELGKTPRPPPLSSPAAHPARTRLHGQETLSRPVVAARRSSVARQRPVARQEPAAEWGRGAH